MRKGIYVSVFWILLGVVLNAMESAGQVDEFWGGLGFALMMVGLLQVARLIRYQKDAQYREAVDVNHADERNRFLANKAWAWGGYWLVLLYGAGTIIFKLLNREDLMMFCAGTVCLMLVLYWLCYLVLKRKY